MFDSGGIHYELNGAEVAEDRTTWCINTFEHKLWIDLR